jgi:hypothetical protein
MPVLQRILLWLLVVNLGMALGAGVYESRIVVPQWITSSPDQTYRWNADAARESDTGLRFWVYVTTVPLTLLTLANLVTAWRAVAPVRGWWLAAALTALLDRLFTFAYFIPTMVGLMRENMTQSQAVPTALQWASLNHLRHAILLAALLAAMKAFSLLYHERGRQNAN